MTCSYCNDSGSVLIVGPYPGRISPRHAACPVCKGNNGYPFHSDAWQKKLPAMRREYAARKMQEEKKP